MISICIPVYNFDVKKLVNELNRQGDDSGVPYEIVLIDDCSNDEFRLLNQPVFELNKFIQLSRNVGRARIRNLFPEHARYDKLLFLDCDSCIVSGDFLKNYIKAVRDNGSPVICGGRIYSSDIPPRNMKLRWKYGFLRESQPPTVRQSSSFRYFMTNNFLIDRAIITRIRFDERLVEYGYEDTLFGYRLMKMGISVKHIDNPVLHSCTEDNAEFLIKTEESINNLVQISGYINNEDGFVSNVKILSVFHRIGKLGLTTITRQTINAFKPLLKGILSRGYIWLWMFDLYKLGILMQIKKTSRAD
jgi:GT2 family glycosyltransferase